MATETLKVKVTADASQAKAEIGKFKSSLKEVTQTGDVATKSIGKTAAALAGVAVALKAVKSMVKSAVDVATAGDALRDDAQKVFMSTTAYQEWGYVLKQNGVELGTLKTGMRQFAQQVANGSEALQKYGITATDVDTAFSQAIATIQNMSTETEKIAAATELFGSRALELFPVLNLTNAETQSLMNTYRALGGTMSNELIAASDICADSIQGMKAAWGGLRNLLASYFLPVITKIVQWITLTIAKIRILLSALFGVKETFGGSGKTSLPRTSGSVATNTGNTANNLKKAAKHAKELKRTLMGIDELSKLAEKATAAAASPSGGGGGGGGSIGDVGIGDSGIESLISEDTMKKIEDFRKRVEEIKEGFSLIVKGIKDVFSGDWDSGLAKIKEGIEKIFPGIKELKEKWADLKENVKDIVANIKAQIATKWADLKQKWEEIVNNIKDKVANLKAQIATKWSDLKEKWNGIVGNIKDKAADLKAKIATKWSDLKAKWHNVVDNIKDKTVSMKAKIGTTWGSIKAKWKNLLAKFKDKTVSIGLKFSAAAADLKKWINTNVIDRINAKFQNVPILRNHLIPHLASGGVLTAPTMAMVGEYPGARNNPEIATPQSLMYETILKANGELAAANAMIGRQIIAAIEGQDLTVKIGDDTIARSAQRGNAAYHNRTGKPLFTT